MKTKLLPACLLIAMALTLSTSCSRDDNTDNSPTANLSPGHCSITCTISGAATSNFASNALISVAEKNNNYMNISGGAATASGTEMALIVLNVNVQPGTYDIANQNDDAEFSFAKTGNGWGKSTATPFTITVTSVTSTTIEGTFQGSLTNDTDHSVIAVSNGKFAARFNN